MAFTHHGHEIVGSRNFGPEPSWRVMCGGPEECIDCRLDVAAFSIRGRLPRRNFSAVLLLDALVKAVVTAWLDSGVTPDSFHEAKQMHLLVDWPDLGQAIKKLSEETTR